MIFSKKIASALALAFLVAGCAESPSVLTEWTYSFDSDCLDPTDRQLASLDIATSLWAEWGVNIHPGIGGDHFTICFMDSEPRENTAGLTSGSKRRISVGPLPCDVDAVVMTHEIGHLVLTHDDHLPSGQSGIMAAQITCETKAEWSEDDVAHLEWEGL